MERWNKPSCQKKVLYLANSILLLKVACNLSVFTPWFIELKQRWNSINY